MKVSLGLELDGPERHRLRERRTADIIAELKHFTWVVLERGHDLIADEL